MPEIIIDPRSRLDQARADRAANEAALVQVEARKAEASKAGREAFAEWSEEFNWRSMEQEGLTLMITTLEREVADDNSAAAEAGLLKRYEEQRDANEDLAKRIVINLRKANELYLEAIRAVAIATIETAAINEALPPGLEPLIPTDILARSRSGLPREKISSRKVWFWTRRDNGAIVGNSDQLEDLGGGKGVIKVMHGPPIKCVQTLHEEVNYHPAEPTERPIPLWQVRLIDPDGPRSQYDGMELDYPRDVLKALDRFEQALLPRRRPVLTETVALARPVPPDEIAALVEEDAHR